MGDPAIKAALKEATWTMAQPHPGNAQQHVAAAVATFLRAYWPHRAPQGDLGPDIEELAAAVEAAANER